MYVSHNNIYTTPLSSFNSWLGELWSSHARIHRLRACWLPTSTSDCYRALRGVSSCVSVAIRCPWLTTQPWCSDRIHAATVLQGNGKPIPFKSVVLVEPVLLPSDVCEALLSRLVQPTASRKWQWKSRDEASQYVTKAFPWKSWHKEMQDVFLVSSVLSSRY